jgi:hypothetical protein
MGARLCGIEILLKCGRRWSEQNFIIWLPALGLSQDYDNIKV